MPRQSLSVIVPVLDEVESLPAFHAELIAALDDLDRPCEIVYVDDGSTDGSAGLLGELAGGDPRVQVVVLRRNFGKSGALAAGFDAATGDLLATLDADGQDPPDELALLLDHLESSGADMVGGWRQRRSDRLIKRVSSRLYNRVTRLLTGLDLHDLNTGMKLLRREVAEELPLYGELHRYVPVMAHDLGFVVAEVPVTNRPRIAGRSKYMSVLRFPKTLLDLLTVLFLTRFGDRPSYLFGGVGAVLAGVGVTILIYLSVLRLVFDAGIGQRPLLQAGVLAVLVGVQLVGTGFIGDVLRHSYAREQRPYRVRKVLRGADPASGTAAEAGPEPTTGPAHPASPLENRSGDAEPASAPHRRTG